jgi:hypothetical protein
MRRETMSDIAQDVTETVVPMSMNYQRLDLCIQDNPGDHADKLATLLEANCATLRRNMMV